MNIPPGYVTKARADYLTAHMLRSIDDICARVPDRIAARWPSATTPEQQRAVLDEECHAAAREIELLRVEMRALLAAPEH
jgi:hypothetical protein